MQSHSGVFPLDRPRNSALAPGFNDWEARQGPVRLAIYGQNAVSTGTTGRWE